MAVAETPDIDPRKRDHAAGSRHAKELTLLGAARGEVLDDQIAFADEDASVAVSVGERGAEHRPRCPHPFPVGRYVERRVMVDEVLAEVFVYGAEVTLGEQGVDERGDGVLVLLNSVHARSLRQAVGLGVPQQPGVFAC